jgi:hypothetical protein
MPPAIPSIVAAVQIPQLLSLHPPQVPNAAPIMPRIPPTKAGDPMYNKASSISSFSWGVTDGPYCPPPPQLTVGMELVIVMIPKIKVRKEKIAVAIEQPPMVEVALHVMVGTAAAADHYDKYRHKRSSKA